MKKFFNKRNGVFVGIFTVLGLIALQFPLTKLIGSDVRFTIFDLFGPLATGFIGLIPGLVSVALMQLGNFFIHGAEVVDAGVIVRFFPMLFAAWYFWKKNTASVWVSVLAIVAFNLHPIGRSAWVYSMFWLIPIIMHFLRDKSLMARALGTTFTAHAVGGALWVWVFGLSKEIWLGLIPVVMIERTLMALGIVTGFLAFNNLLAYLQHKRLIRLGFTVDQKYLWFRAK
ncbi:MAG: hypothetical protein Q8Q20_03575 [bacterium]|nr:hypothetical protein [bacterium]